MNIFSYKLARISAAIFVLVVVLALLFKPVEQFKVDVKTIHQEVISNKNFATVEMLSKVNSSSNNEYLVVDVRTPGNYIKTHLPNAVNIPGKDMLAEKYRDIFKNNTKPVVVYGKYSCDAHRACIMLRQMGIENISIIAGGYDYFIKNPKTVFPVESAKYDFAKIMKEKSGGKVIQSSSAKKPVIRKAKKKKTRAEGGC